MANLSEVQGELQAKFPNGTVVFASPQPDGFSSHTCRFKVIDPFNGEAEIFEGLIHVVNYEDAGNEAAYVAKGTNEVGSVLTDLYDWLRDAARPWKRVIREVRFEKEFATMVILAATLDPGDQTLCTIDYYVVSKAGATFAAAKITNPSSAYRL